MRRTLRTLAVVAISCVTAVSAQPRSGAWGRPDIPYDGGLTFVRLRWTFGTFGARVAGRGVNMWLHEFPRAEQNLMAVLRNFTLIDANTDGSLILTLDDPQPVQASDRPDAGTWLLGDDRRGSGALARVPDEGRVRDL